MSEEVSENTAGSTVESQEGVQASDVNNWEQMARNAQSKADKYEAVKGKYGDNFEDKLDGFSEFEKQWVDNPKGTIERLSEQAGIKINEPVQEKTSEDDNVWEILQQGSSANKKLEDKIAAISNKASQEAVAKYKQEQQVNDWRAQLSSRGITDYKKQNEAIREFLNPNPDFNQFLQSKVSEGQPPANQPPRPSEVMQQVSRNQAQPQSAGVLEGGMPPQKSWEEEKIAAVEQIAKNKRGNENF